MGTDRYPPGFLRVGYHARRAALETGTTEVSANLIIEQLVNGVTLGGMYALIALGYTMVYGILLMINFAHSELFMSGAFVGLGTMTLLSSSSIAAKYPALAPFQKFFTGSGFGLAFVKRVALAHGGSVSLTSRPHEGTTVSLRLQADDGPIG